MSRSALADEFLACWRVIMTTLDDVLFTAAVNRGRELIEHLDPNDLEKHECVRILCDSAVLAVTLEWGPCGDPPSYEETLRWFGKSCRGGEAMPFFLPEFARHLRVLS